MAAAVPPAVGHEVSLGVEQSIEAQSNVFRRAQAQLPGQAPGDDIADGIYRIKPLVRLRQIEDDRLTYNLRAAPAYSVYFVTDNLDGWDVVINGWADYQITQRDRLRFTTGFTNIRSIRSQNIVDETGDPLLVVDDDGRTQRFQADLEYIRSLNSRMQLSLGANYDRWDYDRSNAIDNQGVSATGGFVHAITRRLAWGFDLTGRYRGFVETALAPGVVRPASISAVVNLNLLARLSITPTINFDVSGGPAYVYTDQDLPTSALVPRWFGVSGAVPRGRVFLGCTFIVSCPLDDAAFLTGRLGETSLATADLGNPLLGRSNSAPTYFISAAIKKEFVRGSALAAFTRSEDAGSGQGNVSILNSLVLQANYSLSDDWRLFINGVFNLRSFVTRTATVGVQAVLSTEPGAVSDNGFPLAESGQWTSTLATTALQNDLKQYWVEASAQRRLSEKSYLQLKFRYYYQNQQASLTLNPTEFDNISGIVTFNYEFDAIRW